MPFIQRGMLSHIFPWWGMEEERWILVMYTVRDAQSDMSLVWDGGGD